MSEVYIVTQDVRVYQLPHILLLVVTTDSLVLEFTSDLRHFLVYYLLFLVFGLAVPDISNIE
jgi:hypothetical protein